MVLCTATTGAPLPSAGLDAVLGLQEVQQATQAFLAGAAAGSTITAPAAAGGVVLCVLQGEAAVARLDSAPWCNGLLIGSQDATTCLVVVLASQECVFAAHLDDVVLGAHDLALLARALGTMQQPCLWLVGGYCDAHGLGPSLAAGLLQLLHSLPQHIRVQLCCVGPANTSADGRPLSCSLVVNTRTMTPHPWLFHDRGPQLPRRMAAMHCCRCETAWLRTRMHVLHCV